MKKQYFKQSTGLQAYYLNVYGIIYFKIKLKFRKNNKQITPL